MSRAAFQACLEGVRKVHAATPALHEFCPWPDDLAEQAVEPKRLPCFDAMRDHWPASPAELMGVRDAFIDAGAHAHWRETYKGTSVGSDFLDRFGCYSLIGNGGAYISAQMWAWVVTMPPRLHYPWHHHPGEETYMILAGEAVFEREGQAAEVLRAGDTVFHGSNQPHATTTQGEAMMALVLWRNGFQTPPVLTEERVA